MLILFAVLAASDPGRIDINDGQSRYEAGRNLVDHHDPDVRDPTLVSAIYIGRDGHHYSNYRLPQSVCAALAVVVSDLLGAGNETRRQFLFAMTSPVMGALLGGLYARWFSQRGHAPSWAILGVLATPCWYYSTSSFDDILGAVAVVGALQASSPRDRGTLASAVRCAVWLGLAYNCKPPLAAFVVPVAVWQHAGERLATRRAIVVGGLFLGMACDRIFAAYKFPLGLVAPLAFVPPIFFANPVRTIPALLFSPVVGLLPYCPPFLIALVGVFRSARTSGKARADAETLLFASLAFGGFISLLTFFMGDPAWGPRYLTPCVAALWLFAPEGAQVLGRGPTRALITMGLGVQLLAISVDPLRLYIRQQWASTPVEDFADPASSQLAWRPRQILEVTAWSVPVSAYSPATPPTAAPAGLDESNLHAYAIYDRARPWWIAQWWLAPDDRPVPIPAGLVGLAMLGALGIGLLWTGQRAETGPEQGQAPA